MHNYRICFDYSAETPRDAILYLLGVIEDPEMRNMPFNWLVIDQGTGEEHKIRCTLAELARDNLKEFLDGKDQS